MLQTQDPNPYVDYISNNEGQRTAGFGNHGSTHSGNNRRRQLYSIDSNNPTKKKNFENDSPAE